MGKILQAGAGMSESDAEKTCVLVVDDEEMIRETATQMLERRGFSTLAAADGEQGIELLRQNADRVRAVLIDHSMPRMSGLDALQAMRQIVPGLPAIVITGYRDALDQYDEADTILQKPFSLKDLVSAVRKLVEDD